MIKHTGMAESVDALGSNPSEATRGGSSPPPGTHTCLQCGKEQPVTEFSPLSQKNPAPRSECKTCARERSKAYRRKNLEMVREKERARRKARERRKEDARLDRVDGPCDPYAQERIDGAPFQAGIDGMFAKGGSYKSIANGTGVHERTLRRAHREQRRVSLSVVDRVLLGNGVMLWEVYDD